MRELKDFMKHYPGTSSLLAGIGLVFIVMQLRYPLAATSVQAVFEMGGLLGVYMKADPMQWWRLVSSLFLHVGWEHFIFNGFALLVLGRQMEPILGTSRFLLLYGLSGLMGNAFAFFFTPLTIVAGASGAIYGLSAMFAVLYYFVKTSYIRHIGQMQVGFLVAGAIMSFLTPNVSIAGHLGGAVGGAFCAFFLPIKGTGLFFPLWKRSLAFLAYLGLILFLLWG